MSKRSVRWLGSAVVAAAPGTTVVGLFFISVTPHEGKIGAPAAPAAKAAPVSLPASSWTEAPADAPDADLTMAIQDVETFEPEEFDAPAQQVNDWIEVEADTLAGHLTAIAIDNRAGATQQQIDLMRRTLEESLVAYKQGDADAILRDRLRSGYEVLEQATAIHRNLIERFYLRPGEALPEDPDEVMRLFVSRHYHGEGGSGFHNLFNRISIAASRIEFHEVTDNIATPMHDHLLMLHESGAKRFANGFIAHHPSVEFHHTPADVLRADGRVVYADVWLAATDADDHRYSRFRRYYWVSINDENIWLPVEMISLYAKMRKADAFF